MQHLYKYNNKYNNSQIRFTRYVQKVHVYLKIAIIRPYLLLLVIAANNSNNMSQYTNSWDRDQLLHNCARV